MLADIEANARRKAEGKTAGVISPLVMHSTVLLALASLLMSCIGIVSWIFVRKTAIPAEPAH